MSNNKNIVRIFLVTNCVVALKAEEPFLFLAELVFLCNKPCVG